MARFFGKVGYIRTEDDGTGIAREVVTVREYYGDVNSNVRRWEHQQQSANDDLSLSNNISILADAFAYDNIEAMKWVEYNGTKWRITSVDVNYPRITLYFGGVWNGATD